MAYDDLNNTHNPATGTIAPAAWGDQVRDNCEFLIDPPACSAFNSVGVSVNNATATVLNADSENFDNDAMHSLSLNTSRLTIQTAGRYLLTMQVEMGADAEGYRQAQLLKNGVAIISSVDRNVAINGAATFCGTAITAVLAAGDFIECQAFHTAGNAINVTLRELAALFITR